MLNPDLRDLLSAFCDAEVRFLVVGAYAVGVHGFPRATKDLDVWVDASRANAPRVVKALRAFGAPLYGLTEKELQAPDVILQVGVPPNRVDVITGLSGLSFRSAWPRRIMVPFGEGLVCPVIALPDLLRNKKATGRPQDLIDVRELERVLEHLDRTKRRRTKPPPSGGGTSSA